MRRCGWLSRPRWHRAGCRGCFRTDLRKSHGSKEGEKAAEETSRTKNSSAKEAEKIGKAGLLPNDNVDLAIPKRQFITNEDKSQSRGSRLDPVTDPYVRASLLLQQEFGLRREEAKHRALVSTAVGTFGSGGGFGIRNSKRKVRRLVCEGAAMECSV